MKTTGLNIGLIRKERTAGKRVFGIWVRGENLPLLVDVTFRLLTSIVTPFGDKNACSKFGYLNDTASHIFKPASA